MNKLDSKNPSRDDENWKGYTFEELMYQRAYTTARIEIQKQRIATNFHRLSGGQNHAGSSLMSRFFSGISYLDIGIYTFKLGRGIFRFFRRFKR
ncbi:MAG: hypothetical protein J1E84_06695 [Muribaculaceae bacterium]|nr:hypothetical protein [Muribaculaceae bacterium]